MANLTALLVGAHFRPPAKQLLAALPTCTPLALVPEPDNPYDEHAIKVLLPVASLPDPSTPEGELMNAALTGTGTSLEDLHLADEPLHLGYLPTATNKQHLQGIASGLTLQSNQDISARLAGQDPPWSAELCFTPEGSPMVRLPDYASGDLP